MSLNIVFYLFFRRGIRPIDDAAAFVRAEPPNAILPAEYLRTVSEALTR